MSKIKIFLWQKLHNTLPMRGIWVRGMQVDPTCPLCMNDIESNDNLFWECPSIKRVWGLASQHKWLQLPEISHGPRRLKQLILRCKQSRNSDDIVKVVFLLWSIWKGRNAIIFQHEVFGPLWTLIRAKRSYAERRIWTCMPGDTSSRRSTHRRSTSNLIVTWNTP